MGTSRMSMTVGQMIAAVIGSVLVLGAVIGFAAGGMVLWADQFQRDDDGYVTSGPVRFHSDGHALVTENLRVHMDGTDWSMTEHMFGDVRIRIDAGHAQPIFVGIARTGDVRDYLTGVRHTVVNSVGDQNAPRYREEPGQAPPVNAPESMPIWTVHASGTGTQELTWKVEDGDWTVVVMNASAASGVDMTADIGATVPMLGWLSPVLMGASAFLLVVGGGLLVGAIARASRPKESVKESTDEKA